MISACRETCGHHSWSRLGNICKGQIMMLMILLVSVLVLVSRSFCVHECWWCMVLRDWGICALVVISLGTKSELNEMIPIETWKSKKIPCRMAMTQLSLHWQWLGLPQGGRRFWQDCKQLVPWPCKSQLEINCSRPPWQKFIQTQIINKFTTSPKIDQSKVLVQPRGYHGASPVWSPGRPGVGRSLFYSK